MVRKFNVFWEVRCYVVYGLRLNNYRETSVLSTFLFARLSCSETSEVNSKLKVWSWKTKDIFYGVIT